MANIDVYANNLKRSAYEETNIIRSLKRLDYQLDSCRNSINRLGSSSTRGVSKSLSKISSNLSFNIDSLGSLAKALEEIAAVYVSSEKNILGEGNKITGEKDNIFDGDFEFDFNKLFDKLLEILQGGGEFWGKLYDYFLDKLNPYDAAKLFKSFGSYALGVSFFTGILGMGTEIIDTLKILYDPNSSNTDKAAQYMKLSAAIWKNCGDCIVDGIDSTKTLRYIDKIAGSDTAVNQILVTDRTLEFDTSASTQKLADNITTVVAVGNVVICTGAGGVQRYGEVSADGKITWSDAGSIGVHGSLGGLEAIVDHYTLGLLDFDGEEIADNMDNKVVNFVNGDSWAANYVKDQDNPAVLRFGVSIGKAVVIVGEETVNAFLNMVLPDFIYNN